MPAKEQSHAGYSVMNKYYRATLLQYVRNYYNGHTRDIFILGYCYKCYSYKCYYHVILRDIWKSCGRDLG